MATDVYFDGIRGYYCFIGADKRFCRDCAAREFCQSYSDATHQFFLAMEMISKAKPAKPANS